VATATATSSLVALGIKNTPLRARSYSARMYSNEHGESKRGSSNPRGRLVEKIGLHTQDTAELFFKDGAHSTLSW
jgi:hypothetical protein